MNESNEDEVTFTLYSFVCISDRPFGMEKSLSPLSKISATVPFDKVHVFLPFVFIVSVESSSGNITWTVPSDMCLST